MQRVAIKLWCNDYENAMSKALISTLLLGSSFYEKTSNPQSANLWCLVDEGSGLDPVVALYQSTHPRPKVIYLARTFYPPPVSEWVFFKSPLHVTTLFNWIKSQTFIDPSSNNTTVEAFVQETPTRRVLTRQRWRHEPFKLQFWPNVTLYSDSPDIMAICTTLLRDWSTYDTLPQTKLPPDILDQMLTDAQDEGNIDYQYSSSDKFESDHITVSNQSHSIADNNLTQSNDLRRSKTSSMDSGSPHNPSQASQDKGRGFFKSLLSRFLN